MVTLTNASNAGIVDGIGVGDITDNDALPFLTIADDQITEGLTLGFIVTLTPVSGRDVTFTWLSGDGTAVDTQDYTQQLITSVTILEGTTLATLSVITQNDARDEEDTENMQVTIAGAGNSTIATGTTDADGAIDDNGLDPGGI